jgi:hypothetical protein
MKAKIIFVILLFLLLILCFYVSRNNQLIETQNNNKKEKFQSQDEASPQGENTVQTEPIYSISVISTPFLTYLDTLSRDGKTYINNHIKIGNIFIPIKITPLCKFNVTQNKLIFYFLIDTINDNERNSYDSKIMEPKSSFQPGNKFRNLPLMELTGANIYEYKIVTGIDYTEYIRTSTDLTFMLPHTTDPLDLSSDRDINKLLDIDMQRDSIRKHTTNLGPETHDTQTLIIPRLINSEQTSSLRSLGVSLFNFTVDPEDIEVSYKPSINYTETYQLSSDFYSYQKLNCAQISIIIRNNKFLNLENPGNELKYKFILQSVKDSSDDELIYNTLNYPNNIFNDETNFNINKTSYQLNFYISDAECHKIGTQPLQLVAYLYSNSSLSSGRSNPSALYYEKITNFNLPTTLINREADERILSGIQDAKAEDLLVNYNVYPTFGLNREIEVSPSEGFKDVNPKYKNKIQNQLVSSKISCMFNKLTNYSMNSVYNKKKKSKIQKSYNEFKSICTYIKNYKNNKELLNDFRIINFNKRENFQEGDNIVESGDRYNDNMLILDNFIMNDNEDGTKYFNSRMGQYMYENTGNTNNTQFNEVKIEQFNTKNTINDPNPLEGEKTKKPLEFYRFDESRNLSNHVMTDNNELDVKFLLRKQEENAINPDGTLDMLPDLLNITLGSTNHVKYQFNEDGQQYLYSNNLLFRAQSGHQGKVCNRLIRPGEENISIDNNIANIPPDFKIKVVNNTSTFQRGKKNSRSYCEFSSIGALIFGAILLAILTILTAGAALGPGLALVSSVATTGFAGLLASTAVIVTNTMIAVTVLTVALGIGLVAGAAGYDAELDDAVDSGLLEELQDNLREVYAYEEQQTSDNIRVILNIKERCALYHKERSATTEDLINIKCFGNIKQEGNVDSIIKHPYYEKFDTDYLDEDGNFNDPDEMHTDKCKVRNDLLTVRQFRNKDNTPLNFMPKVIISTNQTINIGSTEDTGINTIIQHGSPHENYIKSFTYMNDENNSDGLNSYIDLCDASISLNNFGGLNYKELYKNYIMSGDGNVLTGIMNYIDRPNKKIKNDDEEVDINRRDPYTVFTVNDEEQYSVKNGILKLDNYLLNNENRGSQGYNHISGEANYIPECSLLYNPILKPYNAKIGSNIMDILYDSMLFNGVNQLLITRQKNSVYTENEKLDLINESIITDIDKFLKTKIVIDDDSTSSFKDVPKSNKSINHPVSQTRKNISSSQNKSCINKNRFPVNDPYYKYNNCNFNNFQDTGTTNTNTYTEDTLGVLNNNSELNVDVNSEDKILNQVILFKIVALLG